jgi:hypothetical protein
VIYVKKERLWIVDGGIFRGVEREMPRYTEAGDDPKVAGLVYGAAFAPDLGQSAGDLNNQYPPPYGGKEIRSDAHGFGQRCGRRLRKGSDSGGEESYPYAGTGQRPKSGITQPLRRAFDVWREQYGNNLGRNHPR